MAFTLDTETQKITFGVVSDLTNDAISIDLASQFGVSELFNDNFSTYVDQTSADASWVSSDTANVRVNIGTDKLDFNFPRDSSNDCIVHDMGVINNTSWVLRFKIRFSSLSASNWAMFGLSDSPQTAGRTTAQDFIGIQWTYEAGDGSQAGFVAVDTDGVALPLNLGTSGIPFAFITDTDYYCEIIRTSASVYSVEVFTDPNYLVSVGKQVGVSVGTTTSLRYIKFVGSQFTGTTEAMAGTIDDIQFWNGVITPRITSDHWRARFKLDITTLNDGGNSVDKRLYIGLFDEDATSGADNNQDGFLLLLAHDNTDSDFIVRSPNLEQPRLSSADATFSLTPSVTTYYVEMRRDSATAGSISFYSNDTYSSVLETQPVTGLSGTIALKYLKLMNDVGFTGTGSIDGTFDNFSFNDLTAINDMGLVAYWKFEETTGLYPNLSEALASGGSSWDLTTTANTRGSSSIDPCQGNALEGTGNGGYLAPSDTSTSLGSFLTDKVHDWSINIWLKEDTESFFWFLNSANSSGSNTGLEMVKAGTGGLFYPRVRQIGSGNAEVYKPGGNFEFATPMPQDTSWHMISFGYKTSDNTLWSSVDGSTKTFESNGGTAVGFTTSNFAIRMLNRAQTPISVGLDGRIDEYSIWSRELTNAELTTLYNGGLGKGIYGDNCGVVTPSMDKTFTIDAILIIRTKSFTIDGIPYMPPAILWVNDALLSIEVQIPIIIDARISPQVGGFGLFRDIGDLVIRVLTENPLGLTGDEITDKIREITEVELEWGFLGKKHRVKGWVNYLFKNGTIQNDNSDPDWWQSVWTLV